MSKYISNIIKILGVILGVVFGGKTWVEDQLNITED